MSNANQFVTLPSGNIRSAKGRMAYTQNVYSPAAQTNDDGTPQLDKNGDPVKKYQLTLVFPKGTDFKPLQEKVHDTAVAKWGPDYKTKINLKKPFLKVEDYLKMGFDPDKFEYFIRLSVDAKRGGPEVRRADKTKVPSEQQSEVYSGRWAYASFNLYATQHPRGGARVSCGLANIQLLDNDEPVGGGVRASADEEFEAVAIEGAGSTDELFDSSDDPMA
ncbi:MAG TPA: ssDNA-binding protein [Bosea sp. (in: a-proteobacteria)]